MDLFSEQHRFVKAEPVRIIFQNADNAYTVMIVKVHETNEPIEEKELTVVGYFPTIHLHETYHFSGQLKLHPRYGNNTKQTITANCCLTQNRVLFNICRAIYFPALAKRRRKKL